MTPDWRLRRQERYLKGVVLVYRRYRQYSKDWDHDHCEFCGAKFMVTDRPGVLHEGYATEDDYRWICPKCFEDFKDMFGWKVTGESP
jgi:hypothetical protein